MNSSNNINDKYLNLQKKYKQLEKNNLNLIGNLNALYYYKCRETDSFFDKLKFNKNKMDLFFQEKKAKLTKKNDEKISILFFIHTWREVNAKKSTALGGTTNYVIDLVNNYKDKAHIFIMTVINGRYMLVVKNNKKEIVYDLGINVKVKNFDEYDDDFYCCVKSIINELQIDLIHINHIIDFPADLALIASEYRTIVSIHDYTFLCPKYFMFGIDNKICNLPNYMKCSDCVVISKYNYNLRKKSIDKLLTCSSKVIFPNETVISKFKSITNLKSEVVVEHGMDINRFKVVKNYNHKYNINNINIAFVGSVDEHKGGKIVKKVIENSPENYKFHLFGFSGDDYFNSGNSKLINHGKYSRFDLPYLLQTNKIDLILFLNQVEETFSYTLSEVVLSGIPSLAFDIGAIGNRIKNNNLGFVIPITDNYKIIIDKINNIFNNRNDYNEVVNSIKKYKFLDNNEYADIIFNYYMLNYKPRKKNIYHYYRFLRKYWIYTFF